MSTIPRIVVVGGGAGGLELVAGLGKKLGRKNKAHILLIDSSPIHLWKPLLHEFAAGTLYSYEDEISYFAYSANHHFEFCLGTMQDLHRTEKEIVLKPVLDKNQQEFIPERTIPYDILVIAVGSVSNDFNIPGVKEYCISIDNSEQALYFQEHLIKTIMALPYQPKEKQQLNIAIVGGGATGVELAAELHYAVNQLAIYGFKLDPKQVSISLVEASNRLLPALSERISKSVQEHLQNLGIKLFIGEQVSNVTNEGILTKNGKFIPANIKAWAAGIKAPAFLQQLDGLQVNKINQLMVKTTLQTTCDNHIFALGDCAECPQENDGKSVPPRAQAAHQQATFLVKNISYFLEDKPLDKFVYHDYGSLISLSRYEAIGNLMGRLTKSLFIQGKLARLAYLSLYRSHQAALFGYWRVATLILSNWFSSRIRPRLKLH